MDNVIYPMDYEENYPGWTSQSYRCEACGEKWVSVYHLWLNKRYLAECSNCLKKKVVLDNLYQLRGKTMLEQPDLLPINEHEYELPLGYTYSWQVKGPKKRIIIPKGFVTDGASVPRWVWSLTGILPDGLHRAASVVHDYIYQHRGMMPPGSYQVRKGQSWVNIEEPITRKEADQLFLQIMQEAGASPFKSKAMYLAVRTFGWTHW